ncbi:hypothetical protein PYCCODRAFT_1468852 [Trametes coccinea BRFM310]|uniref:Fungal N-terminal domain-containing protein n=1 Tax=Trametes coccinea (strain BRFM310) TaxID=1353009 RepID=A0A1Y2IMH8_TRAC3|nr:hypothetical protein PYCCODRAFT_1468852 [Trametes coccinea BRFM310]
MLDSEKFDLAVGIIGLLSFPIAIGTLVHTQLPCTWLRELEAIFAETEGLLHTTFEAGLLGPHDIATQFHTRLYVLKQDVEDVRVESHSATTYAQNIKKMLTGLSRRISSLCGEVKKLRADISTTSARERERLRQSQTENPSTCEPCTNPATAATEESSPAPSDRSAAEASTDTERALAGVVAVASINSPLSSNVDSNIVDASSEPSISPSIGTATTTGAPGNLAQRALGDSERGRSLPSPSVRKTVHRHRRYGDSLSRMRVFARLLRGKPSRTAASSDSTRGLMLVSSSTLSSVPNGDDAEWEDLTDSNVLPV